MDRDSDKSSSHKRRLNCWEVMMCGREQGGKNIAEFGVCPAAADPSFDGINSGKCGGRICWAVAGTFCGGCTQGSFADKRPSCLNCEFYEMVQDEEGMANRQTKFLHFLFQKNRSPFFDKMTHRHVKAGERFVVQDAVEDTAYIIQRGSCLVIVEKDGELHPVDPRTDIYALGITAYEMVTGRRPFPEDNAKVLLDLHLTQDVMDPGHIVPDLPDELRRFILKSARCDPDQRFQNIDQAVAVLRPLARDNRRIRDDLTIEKKKSFSLFLTYTDENLPALKRLVDVLKANARELGVELKMTDNQDL